MPNIAIIDTNTHRHLRVCSEASAALGDAQRFVSVVVDEFAQLATYCPIFFAKDADNGAFYCGAMLGFDEGENLFLGEAKADQFRPLNLKRLPFFTSGADLAIDLNSPRISTDMGEPLFDDDGRPSGYLERIMGHFQRLRPGEEQTKMFVQTMLQHNLIEPIDIDIAFDDGTQRHLEGLYVINKVALGALPDDDAVALFRRGYIYLAHTMMQSLNQMPALIDRRNQRQADADTGFLL